MSTTYTIFSPKHQKSICYTASEKDCCHHHHLYLRSNFNGDPVNSMPYSYSSHIKRYIRAGLTIFPTPIFTLSRLPSLATTLDVMWNKISGSIPNEIGSIMSLELFQLDNNHFDGSTMPASFGNMSHLLKLSLRNCSLQGQIPDLSRIPNLAYIDLSANQLNGSIPQHKLSEDITTMLRGNPICLRANMTQLCASESEDLINVQTLANANSTCPSQACPPPYQYAPASPVPCFCAAPLLVGYRLKSPGFWDFPPYIYPFEVYLTSGLTLELYQLDIDSFEWQKGPRLMMYLKIFPVYIDNSSYIFNKSEVLRIRSMFTGWTIPDSEVFGPYELLNFTLLDPYKDVIPYSSSSGLSKGALAGVVIGAIAGAVTLSAIVSLIVFRSQKMKNLASSKRPSRMPIKIDGVKSFTYGETTLATNNFSNSALVGQGGYGKVYKGILADGAVVAIKRAQEGSLQGEKEFLTEIELLSRLHHRNLVSLVGYCDEEGEQMLIYEFMPNGTLRDHLSATGKSKEPLSFAARVRVALGSAKGILYLHTEADPPIFHRDIKATNILLDSRFNAKVADFGLSRLAPVPDFEGTLPAHVSTVVKGTPGYLDPEYFLTHKLTDKSDVYSLGVVFLELLTGMQPISHGKNIVREVNVAYRSGMIFSVIDERMGSYPSECVEKFVSLALKCCQEETDARPSMTDVVRELESIWHMMPESDTRTSHSSISDPGKIVSPQPSSSMSKNPYVSSDVSGSDLLSGVIPTITPR
ncbi:hypothetical protein RJ639_028271 [Escallonia herrerae]|uniref:non-specific serine/threonine protein kinase n=1 Tax=Escallonia herrerae TaxID=1293975 RepID=A0AA88XAL0_9ASTE|nr:hypothetical protein RJ639_028271 [Escallonia herrerae]